MQKIDEKSIAEYRRYLLSEERSAATAEKYVRDISAFFSWTNGAAINKALVMRYKEELILKYAPSSVNSVLSSLNGFFTFLERRDCTVKTIKIQRQIFAKKERELTKAEYERLLRAAKRRSDDRLYYLMQTICATGIRVSELKFITCEAVRRGRAQISCKGKLRIVILPKALCKMLKSYISRRGIKSGAVFVTRNGKAVDRSNIWSDMKRLACEAGVTASKVFPHNLRHLFARTYYSLKKDIARLADILGHSNINTTRIYTMESGDTHRKQLDRLGLLRC